MNLPLQKLFEVDMKFCETCKVKGVEGWLSYMAKESFMGSNLHNPYIEGLKAIRKVMTPVFDLEDLNWDWQPQRGFVSKDETLGVTTGISTRSFMKDGKKIVQKGQYTTVWIKEDGLWKVQYDMGN
jgi:hypothetical protein